jgi:hypothetical protein
MKKQFPSNSLTLCKSQAIIDEAKKRQIKIISIRLSKNPLGDLKGLPKQKTLAAENNRAVSPTGTPCQRDKCDHYHQCQVCEDSSNFTIMGG